MAITSDCGKDDFFNIRASRPNKGDLGRVNCDVSDIHEGIIFHEARHASIYSIFARPSSLPDPAFASQFTTI